MARRLIPFLASVPILFGWSGISHAQLADPTRPAIEAGASIEAMPGAAPLPAGGLQSVIMRKAGKPAALINGTVIELGGMVGEAKLVKITEDAVVLRGPGGEEILRLTPAAEKKSERDGVGGKVKRRADGKAVGQ